ncbi:hypothetical protein AB0G64_33790 [Streptomyces longwoodensis]|uniref:hypothetical protein n=1 Tax=Streptomyces longwoodensis TaxID=68231 RepID=UPI0033F5EF32
MSETNNDTSKQSATRQTASKTRGAAGKATAPAAQTAKKTADAAGDAASTAKGGAARAADATSGVAHSAADAVATGRKAVITASGHVAATAKTAWTVIAHRKLVAAGVGAGITALSAASYALGRRSGHQPQGPLTRLTNGRI